MTRSKVGKMRTSPGSRVNHRTRAGWARGGSDEVSFDDEALPSISVRFGTRCEAAKEVSRVFSDWNRVSFSNEGRGKRSEGAKKSADRRNGRVNRAPLDCRVPAGVSR